MSTGRTPRRTTTDDDEVTVLSYDPAYPDPAYSPPPGRPQKRLTRSDDRWVAGICGGIADYFGVDAALVRVLFVASILLPGPQFFLYLVLWFVMPGRKT